ncbi:ovomucoid-like [Pogona vitticeps]
MKALGGFLLLTLMMFFLYSDATFEGTYTDVYCHRSRRKICTSKYLPVCGSDNITYGNTCLFCKAYIQSGRRLGLKSLRSC